MQLRYHNFQRVLASLDENHRLMGPISPGVICGWDRITAPGGNTLNFHHDLTGVVKTQLNGSASDPMGCVATRQGVMVYEDAAVGVDVDFNPTDQWRVDALILSHSFLDSPGGSVATYSVIKGATNLLATKPQFWNYPTPSNLALQVLIGYIFIPPVSVNHLGTKWQRLDSPAMGGGYAFKRDGLSNVPELPNTSPHYNDFNALVQSGIFYVNIATNAPSTATTEWFLSIQRKGANVVQTALSKTKGRMYSRSSVDTGLTWTPWVNQSTGLIGNNFTAVQADVAGDTILHSYTIPKGLLEDGMGVEIEAWGDMKANPGIQKQIRVESPSWTISTALNDFAGMSFPHWHVHLRVWRKAASQHYRFQRVILWDNLNIPFQDRILEAESGGLNFNTSDIVVNIIAELAADDVAGAKVEGSRVKVID